LQPAGANTILAILVLLNLLEGYADLVAELRLSHLYPFAEQPNPRADQDINWILLWIAFAYPQPKEMSIADFWRGRCHQPAIFSTGALSQNRYPIASE
jgi:hypothetical protein